MGLDIAKDKPLGTQFNTAELTDNNELLMELLGEKCSLVKITFSFLGENEGLVELGVSSKDFNEEDYET